MPCNNRMRLAKMRGIINDLLESVQTIKERATLSRILLCSGSSLLMRLYWFTDKNIPMFVEVQIHKDSIRPHHVLFTYLTLNTKFRPHNEVNVIILSAVTSACGFWANSSAFFFFFCYCELSSLALIRRNCKRRGWQDSSMRAAIHTS